MSRALAFICLSLLYVSSFSGVCKAEEEVPQLLRDAKDYEDNNQYGVAFEKIINCAKNTEDKACYRELGEFLDRRKNVLPPLEHEQVTIFSPRGFKFKVQHPVLGYWRLLKKLHRVS